MARPTASGNQRREAHEFLPRRTNGTVFAPAREPAASGKSLAYITPVPPAAPVVIQAGISQLKYCEGSFVDRALA